MGMKTLEFETLVPANGCLSVQLDESLAGKVVKVSLDWADPYSVEDHIAFLKSLEGRLTDLERPAFGTDVPRLSFDE